MSADTIITIVAVDIRVYEAEKWAEQQLKENPIDPEELKKGFEDMIVYGEEKYHVSSEGIKHIPIWGENKEEIPTIQTTGPSGQVEEHQIKMPIYNSLEEIYSDCIEVYKYTCEEYHREKMDMMKKIVEKLDKSYRAGRYLCNGERG